MKGLNKYINKIKLLLPLSLLLLLLSLIDGQTDFAYEFNSGNGAFDASKSVTFSKIKDRMM